MSTSETLRPCPACGDRRPRTIERADGKRAIGGGPLELARCPGCGARFQPTVPGAEELARWYDYMGHNPANVAVSPLITRRLRRMVGAFAGVRQTGRLLEVGCGGGLFVRSAIAAGWEVWGTEISPSCVAVLRPLLGARLHQGTIEDAPFPAASFDGAALIEVVEHLADPDLYLAALARLLRPGGRLFLTTPNAGGSAGRVLGTRWRAFTDEHLNYFDRRSIAVLLERHGFGELRISTTNLDLLVLGAQHARALLRPAAHGNVGEPISQGTPPPFAPAHDPSPAPSVAPALSPDSGALRPRLADLAIEAVNRVATLTRLGDTLRVVATRR